MAITHRKTMRELSSAPVPCRAAFSSLLAWLTAKDAPSTSSTKTLKRACPHHFIVYAYSLGLTSTVACRCSNFRSSHERLLLPPPRSSTHHKGTRHLQQLQCINIPAMRSVKWPQLAMHPCSSKGTRSRWRSSTQACSSGSNSTHRSSNSSSNHVGVSVHYVDCQWCPWPVEWPLAPAEAPRPCCCDKRTGGLPSPTLIQVLPIAAVLRTGFLWLPEGDRGASWLDKIDQERRDARCLHRPTTAAAVCHNKFSTMKSTMLLMKSCFMQVGSCLGCVITKCIRS